MKVELYVAVEINDDAAAMLDATYVGGAAGAVIDLVRGTVATQKGFRKVTVDVAEVADDGPQSDADALAPPTPTRDTPKGRTGLSDRQGISVAKGTGERPGRPATLHNLRAADGEPVRSFGPRSRETLESQGIAVWDESAGETGPTVRRNSGERAVPQRAGKPTVMKRRG